MSVPDSRYKAFTFYAATDTGSELNDTYGSVALLTTAITNYSDDVELEGCFEHEIATPQGDKYELCNGQNATKNFENKVVIKLNDDTAYSSLNTMINGGGVVDIFAVISGVQEASLASGDIIGFVIYKVSGAVTRELKNGLYVINIELSAKSSNTSRFQVIKKS